MIMLSTPQNLIAVDESSIEQLDDNSAQRLSEGCSQKLAQKDKDFENCDDEFDEEGLLSEMMSNPECYDLYSIYSHY